MHTFALILLPHTLSHKQVDLLGCGLQSSGPHDVAAASGNGSPAVTFNPNEPDGVYDLDLSTPSQRQVGRGLRDIA